MKLGLYSLILATTILMVSCGKRNESGRSRRSSRGGTPPPQVNPQGQNNLGNALALVTCTPYNTNELPTVIIESVQMNLNQNPNFNPNVNRQFNQWGNQWGGQWGNQWSGQWGNQWGGQWGNQWGNPNFNNVNNVNNFNNMNGFNNVNNFNQFNGLRQHRIRYIYPNNPAIGGGGTQVISNLNSRRAQGPLISFRRKLISIELFDQREKWVSIRKTRANEDICIVHPRNKRDSYDQRFYSCEANNF